MPVVTIARQYGSLGDEVGEAVARQVGLQLVDQNAVTETAQRLHLSAEGLSGPDEWEGTVVSDLVRTMQRLYPATIGSHESGQADQDESAHLPVIRRVICELAQNNNVVIVGRGATHILASNPQVLHVLTIAPLPVRIERVMQSEGMDLQKATQRVRNVDNNRARYVRHFYGANWLDVEAYDLVLNTGRISLQVATSLICAAIQQSPADIPKSLS